MADRLGTIHHEVEVSARDIAEVFPDVMRHVESPVLRTAPAPMYLLARLVRRSGYKVVVTGEGADEVLGGYDIFREARVRGFWARNPHSTRRDRAVELLYPWMATSPGQAPAFARGFFGLDLDPADPAMSHRPRWNTTSRLRSLPHRRHPRRVRQGADRRPRCLAATGERRAGIRWLEPSGWR